MNDLIDGFKCKETSRNVLVYTQQPLHILDAVYELSHAKSKLTLERVALIALGLNVMYGDARDNVAWWASGKLYKHKEGVDTILFWMELQK
jgi:penicillin amidase